jgi:pyruvate carboxylase
MLRTSKPAVRPGAPRSTRLLFPAPAAFRETRDAYGDLSVLDTADYLYGLAPGTEHVVEIERGVQLYVGLEAIGDADERGMRTVMVTTLNGNCVPSSCATAPSRSRSGREADATVPGHVAAPFSGVVTPKAAVGDRVSAGQPVASIEAMKMEAAITAPMDGIVERLVIGAATAVEAGDLCWWSDPPSSLERGVSRPASHGGRDPAPRPAVTPRLRRPEDDPNRPGRRRRPGTGVCSRA